MGCLDGRRAEDEARRAAAAEQQRKRRRRIQTAVLLAIGIPVAGLLWLQFATLNGYIPAGLTVEAAGKRAGAARLSLTSRGGAFS